MGEPAKPDVPIAPANTPGATDLALSTSSLRLEKLDSMIDAEHVEAAVAVVNPRHNVVSRDRAQ